MKLKKTLLKYLSPQIPIEQKLSVARGEVELEPEDLLTVLFVLSYEKDETVSNEARRGLAQCPEKIVMKALLRDLPAEVIAYITKRFAANEKILDLIILNDNTDDKTLEKLAQTGPESLVYMLIESGRLFGQPALFSALEKNPNARVEALEHAGNLMDTYTANGAKGASSNTALTCKELLEDQGELAHSDNINIFNMVQEMTVGEKIKLAFTGNKEARALLLKQTNKVVARSVIRNPRITDDEIIAITLMRSVSDEILREIARNDEWTKNYQIRKGLVFNPKTPIPVSLSLVPKIYEKDLWVLARSRGVPHVVSGSARRLLEKKNK